MSTSHVAAGSTRNAGRAQNQKTDIIVNTEEGIKAVWAGGMICSFQAYQDGVSSAMAMVSS